MPFVQDLDIRAFNETQLVNRLSSSVDDSAELKSLVAEMLDDARKPRLGQAKGVCGEHCCLCRAWSFLSNDGQAGQARREERDRSLKDYKAAAASCTQSCFLQPCVGRHGYFKRR